MQLTYTAQAAVCEFCQSTTSMQISLETSTDFIIQMSFEKLYERPERRLSESFWIFFAFQNFPKNRASAVLPCRILPGTIQQLRGRPMDGPRATAHGPHFTTRRSSAPTPGRGVGVFFWMKKKDQSDPKRV